MTEKDKIIDQLQSDLFKVCSGDYTDFNERLNVQRRVISSYIDQAFEIGMKEENERWINQPANEHDKKIRESLIKELEAGIDKIVDSWKEPDWQFERHETLIDYTSSLIKSIKYLINSFKDKK